MGLYVGLRLDAAQCVILADWAATLPLSRLIPATQLHITLLKDKRAEQVFTPLGIIDPPVIIDIRHCHLKLYPIESGGMALALAVPASWLFKRRKLIKRQLTLKHSSKFFPHVSLCYGADATKFSADHLRDLAQQVPLEMLAIREEYTGPVDDMFATKIV